MACGDRYKHLIVTVDGYTIDNPYGATPFGSDYTGWYSRAEQLVEMANDAFRRLGEVECQKSGGSNCSDPQNASSPSWTKYNSLIHLQNNLFAHFEDLESDWHQISFTQGTVEAIGEAMQVCIEAVCLLDRANVAIQSFGVQPDVLPDITPTPKDDRDPWWLWPLVGAGATLVVGAVGYGLYQRSRAGRNRREPPAPQPRAASADGRPVARRPTGAANPQRPRARQRKRALKAA